MNNATFKTIGEILYRPLAGKPGYKEIVIPNYQRGYKWAVKSNNGVSSVEKLLADIENPCRNDYDYFLQGITVQEDENNLIVIDGQQRLTTIYLLIWYSGGKAAISDINFKYDIREKSETFLTGLKSDESPGVMNSDEIDQKFKPSDSDEQDIYYFKEAIGQIHGFLAKKKDIVVKLVNYIKNRLKVIYITVDSQEKAVRTFTMMNGAKATMLDEELVKAELLRQVSRPLPKEVKTVTSIDYGLDLLRDICAEDWETTNLRSRYAREWDRWLYWWNREDVGNFFGTHTPMGLLLDYFHRGKEENKKQVFSFSSFSKLLKDTKTAAIESDAEMLEINIRTKHVFKELRHLQKSFEDMYDDPIVHNWLGLSFKCDIQNEKYDIIRYFLNNKNDKKALEWYAKCKMAGATHLQIITPDKKEELDSVQQSFLSALLDKAAFNTAKRQCYVYLMYLNVVEDNRLNVSGKFCGRKFDFTVWTEKSLEHIFPKSKVYHTDETGDYWRGDDEKCSEEEKAAITAGDGTWLAREEIESESEAKITEHSIGNLVLLYKGNNSEFGNKTFEEKKRTFFDVNAGFQSRNLLHSVSKFAKSDWRAKEIVENYNEIIKQTETLYEK